MSTKLPTAEDVVAQAVALLAAHVPSPPNTTDDGVGQTRSASGDRWLSATEVAERTGYGDRYVWRLCRNKRIPGAVKPPGTKYWRIPEWGLAEFLAPTDHDRAATTPPPSLPRFELAPTSARKRRRF